MNKHDETVSIRIAPESPLILGTASTEGNFEETTTFIPGATLRGAVAQKALETCSQPDFFDHHAACPDKDDCPFWQLFGQDDILFGNAYPGSAVGPVFPLPLTARECKYHPGLKHEEAMFSDGHGIHDVLITQLIYELISDEQFPQRQHLLPGISGLIPDLHHQLDESCPQCGQSLVPVQGYYTPGDPLLERKRPRVRRHAHVGINRARFAAEDELLFTQEVLDADDTGIQFHGRVVAPQARMEQLKTFLQGEHFIGRGRSRGYGQVKIGVNPPHQQEELTTRILTFQNTLTTHLRLWAEEYESVTFPDKVPVTVISLTLRSPAILESYGQPHLIPKPSTLGLPEAKTIRAWTRPITITGWDAAAKLPRRTRLASKAGSVFVYYLPSALDDEAKAALETLERYGLGAERERGFGQVEICAPIHYQHAKQFGGNHA